MAGSRNGRDGLSALVGRQRPGFALEQAFYTDPAVFERDLERIFLCNWLYAGHVSQIPAPGDFLVFEIAGESVIVVRGEDQVIRALVNVCRHRGSRVCTERRGSAKWFVCPYHGWTYGLDGALRAARHMPADFDFSRHGLKTIHVRVFHGLIFLNFADDPVGFEAAERDLGASLAPFGLDRAKVAHSELYPIAANWKLAVENYIECYHCAPAHPEFSASHSIKLPRARIARLSAAMAARAAEVGLAADTIDHALPAADPSALQYYYDRYPLFDGFDTGSEDGAPLAPLMGDIKGFDGGASNLQLGPVSFFLAYCDHAVAYRFTPRSVRETDVEVVWLVDEDAVEGRDYEVERLTWLWRVTTEADKLIVERNQEGVNSRYYRPGPYTPMESFCRRFAAWYLAALP